MMKRVILIGCVSFCLQMGAGLYSQMIESIGEIESFQITFPDRARRTSKPEEPLSTYVSLTSPSHNLMVLVDPEKRSNLAIDSMDQLIVQTSSANEQEAFWLYPDLELSPNDIGLRLYRHFQSHVEGDLGEDSLCLQMVTTGDHLCVHLSRHFELFKIDDQILKESDLLTYVITDRNVYFISSYGCQNVLEEKQHWDLVHSLKLIKADPS